MPVPTNLSPATALLVSALPYTVTLNAWEVPAETLWFRYDKIAGGHTVLALAQPVPLLTGTYTPEIEAWYDDGGVVTSLLAGNGPSITTPIASGTIVTYYWSVSQPGGTSFTEQLTFDLVAGPVAAVPPGSIIITDDFEDLPVAFVDVTTGAVLQQRPFPSGERADALPTTGESLWEDQNAETVVLYDNQFVLIATLPWPTNGTLTQPPISSNHVDRFYVGQGGSPVQVRTVTTAGAFGPTTWTLGGTALQAIAPSTDDTVLYYVGGGPPAISRWDLVNDVALADLTASLPPGYGYGKDMIAYDDGSVVAYAEGTAPDYLIERYSAAGALLTSYTYEAGWSLNRLCYRDTDSFVAWFFDYPFVAGLARFVQFALDGTVVLVTESNVTSGGVWVGPPPTTPQTGIAVSCPIVITPPPGLPPLTFDEPEPVPGYGLRTVPQRRLRRAPHLTDEARWLFYTGLQIDMQTGVGLVSGQGEDPQVMLRWSDDGGQTWSREHWTSAGRMGATKTRVSWNRLGRSRDRVFEVVVSDPCAFYLAAAYLDVTPGNGT